MSEENIWTSAQQWERHPAFTFVAGCGQGIHLFILTRQKPMAITARSPWPLPLKTALSTGVSLCLILTDTFLIGTKGSKGTGLGIRR